MGSPLSTGRKTFHIFGTDDDTGEQGGITITCVDGACTMVYSGDVPIEVPDPGIASVEETVFWASSLIWGDGRLRGLRKVIQFIPPAKRAG